MMKRNKHEMEFENCIFCALHLQTKNVSSGRHWSSAQLQVIISDASSRFLTSKMLFDWCVGFVELFGTLKMYKTSCYYFCNLLSSCMPITLAKVHRKSLFPVKARTWRTVQGICILIMPHSLYHCTYYRSQCKSIGKCAENFKCHTSMVRIIVMRRKMIVK